MTEHVIPIHPETLWDPNAPVLALATDDSGKTALGLRPHPDDRDTRCVVLRWSSTSFLSVGGPNDEAIAGHRLFMKGLAEVSWLGSVIDSELIAFVAHQNSVHPHHDPDSFAQLHHWVVLTKEKTIEVVARELGSERFPGSTTEAATAGLLLR